MTDDQAETDGSRRERTEDQSHRGGTPAAASDEPSSAVGITDEDMEQIHSFLAKRRHQRSVDDLRPPER